MAFSNPFGLIVHRPHTEMTCPRCLGHEVEFTPLWSTPRWGMKQGKDHFCVQCNYGGPAAAFIPENILTLINIILDDVSTEKMKAKAKNLFRSWRLWAGQKPVEA